jgi:hypothetical protein
MNLNANVVHKSNANGKKVRNFDLTVEEIKLEKSINQLTNTAKNLEHKEPDSQRAKIIREEIRRLEEKLDEIRDNTLIR